MTCHGLDVSTHGRRGHAAKFDLSFTLDETRADDGDAGYGRRLSYATDLFDAATVR